MKQRTNGIGLLKIVTDAVLLACAMLASTCAVPSAFSVPFEVTTLIWMCALAALLLSGWLHLPRAGIAFGAVFMLVTIAYGVYDRSMIVDGARYTWYYVLKPLSADFSFLPVPAPVGELENPAAAVTAFLVILAVVYGMFTAFALIRGKMVLLTVLMPLPLYMVSLIYTNQPPALWTAILLLIYCGGVLVGHGLRKHRSKQRSVVTAILLPLLLVLLLLLRMFSPSERYEPIPFEQRQAMLGRTVGQIRDRVLSWITYNPPNIDLSGEGNRKQDEKPVFSLYVTSPGTYLLRTHSYGHYENSTWKAASPYDGEWQSMSALGRGQSGVTDVFSIRNVFSSERIVPYGFIEDPEVEVSESFVHAQGRTAYGWTALSTVSLNAHAIDDAERAYAVFAKQQYTMPDGEEKDALKAILKDVGIAAGPNVYQTALNVAAYVRGSASYNLSPGKTPSDADFVQYFLTESHEGYCVHFASATTALLQALGVPARYTVGYSVTVPIAEVWTEVPSSAEHAWTEVYVQGVGWIPVESTAGFGNALATGRQGSGGNQQGVTARPVATPTPKPTATPRPSQSAAAATLEPKPGEQRTPRPTASATEIDPQSGETVIREDDARTVSPWWLLLLLTPALPIGWLFVGGVLRRRRKHAFLQKNAKKAILAMARYRAQLERCGLPPDPDVDAWAEEAMFSNHPMTAERKELYARITAAQKTLYRNKPLKRFIARWILVRI